MTLVNFAQHPGKVIGKAGTTTLEVMPPGKPNIFQQCNGDSCTASIILSSNSHIYPAIILEVDELHVMHLGTTMYMLGAVLYLLCFHVLAGDPEDIMHGIWTDISDF